MSDPVLLEATGIYKAFSGTQALQGIDFDLRQGELHAVVGENGAGKSTLLKILSGVYKPDAGEIKINGRCVEIKDPSHAREFGIGIVHQELNLSDTLSIAENLFINRLPLSRMGLIDWKKLDRETTKFLELFDIHLPPKTRVSNLALATKRVIEILTALSRKLDILILDEPTAALTEGEVVHLFSLIRKLTHIGVGVIYVSHYLKEVFQIADRITVLRDGRKVGTYGRATVDEETIITAEIGKTLEKMRFDQEVTRDEKDKPLVQLNGLDGKGFRNVSFKIEPGEIVSLAGLASDGRREVGEILFGLSRPSAGDIHLDGEKVRVETPEEAVRLGIGWLPEDRKLQGLFLRMTVTENVVAPRLKGFCRLGMLNFSKQQRVCKDLIEVFRIVVSGPSQIVSGISGGNQQKVLLAKWLSLPLRLFIANEPTRGVDIGSRSEIHQMLRNLTRKKIGIILISNDLDEILSISDRILVFHRKEIVKELDREEASEEKIMAYANMSFRE